MRMDRKSGRCFPSTTFPKHEIGHRKSINERPQHNSHLYQLQRYTNRGPVYQARLDSPEGPLLVNSSLEPEFAASRVLVSRGITGRIEIWDSERPYPRTSGEIEKLAKLTVREDENTPPTLRAWMPFAVATGGPKSAKRGSGLPSTPKRRLSRNMRDRAPAKGRS